MDSTQVLINSLMSANSVDELKGRLVPLLTIVSNGGSYTSYVALLTQTGTSAPVINVLENNTGITFTPSYDDVGAFVLTPDVAPDEDKVTVLGASGSGSGFIRSIFWREGVVNITTVDSDSAPANGVLSNSTIEIRVYP
jgi:hypothetical protein